MGKAVAIPLLILAAASLPAGCDRGPARAPRGAATKITVAVTPWPASASMYIAQDQGYFRDEDLDPRLETYASGHLALAALLSGKADFAAATETPIARAAVNGKPLAVIATVCDIDRGILIIARKDKGISTPDDLRNRRVGLVAGSAAEFFLHIYLITSYVNPGDVRIVDIAPDKLVSALLDGDVDAACTWAPWTTALRDRLGAGAVVFHDPGLYTMTWNIVATRELTRSDPDVIVRFLRAIVRANRFAAEQPAAARAVTAKYTGMDIAAIEKEWGDYRMALMLDQSLILYLEDQARWMTRRRPAGARRVPDFLDVVYTKGLSAVEPDAVRIMGR